MEIYWSACVNEKVV